MKYIELLNGRTWSHLLEEKKVIDNEVGISTLGEFIYMIYQFKNTSLVNNDEEIESLLFLQLDGSHFLQLNSDGNLCFRIIEYPKQSCKVMNIQTYSSEEITEHLLKILKGVNFQSNIWKEYLMALQENYLYSKTSKKIKNRIHAYYEIGDEDPILWNDWLILLVNGVWIYNSLSPLIIEWARSSTNWIHQDPYLKGFEYLFCFPLVLYGNQSMICVDIDSKENVILKCKNNGIPLVLDLGRNLYYNEQGKLILNISLI